MLPFIRSDLAQLQAYTPHPGGSPTASELPEVTQIDCLDTNESPFDLPSELKQKLAWTYQQLIQTNRYPDGDHLSLKQDIATYVNESASHNPTDLHLTSTHISIGNGSDELIRSVLIATCLRGEGSILVANPTFSMYAITARTLGIPVVSVGRNPANFEIDLAAAQTTITETQNPPVRVVFVVHPNSPTGNALTPAELDWLRALPEHILVVIDEAYFEFSQTTVVGELLQRPNWVILRTFSKAFRLAGHRVGYAIAHPELIATLEKIRLPYNLPSFSQAATQAALTHRHQLLESISLILSERARLMRSLTQIPGLQVWPSAANFIFLRINSTQNSQDIDAAAQQVCQYLKTHGTRVRHISQGIRLTIGSPDENNRTLERLQASLGTIIDF